MYAGKRIGKRGCIPPPKPLTYESTETQTQGNDMTNYEYDLARHWYKVAKNAHQNAEGVLADAKAEASKARKELQRAEKAFTDKGYEVCKY
jgi:hypothetical protein